MTAVQVELTEQEIGEALERTDDTLELCGLGVDAREAHYLWRQDQVAVAIARRMAKRMPNQGHAAQVVATHAESARISALLYASHLGAEMDRLTAIKSAGAQTRHLLAKLRALNKLAEEPLRYA
jgi:hypothetical protein